MRTKCPRGKISPAVCNFVLVFPVDMQPAPHTLPAVSRTYKRPQV